MEFKENVDTIYTSELYYDLFEGGYIKPENMLEKEDADKVKEAMNTIKNFLNEASKNNLIEEC